MVDVRQGSGGFSTTTSGAANFWAAGMSYLSGIVDTTDANEQVTYRTAGTMKNLFVNCSAVTSSTTITVRKNASNSALTVTVAASGITEDTTHSFSIAAGDKLNYGTNTGVCTVAYFATTFAATASTTVRCLGNNNGTNVTYSTASLTSSSPLGGGYMSHAGVPDSGSGNQTTIRSAGTISNAIISVGTNSGTTSGTFTSRKNGANGNLSIVVGSSTGILEDTTHSDSVVSSDLVNWAFAAGATSPNVALIYAGGDFTTSAGNVPQIHNDADTGDQPVASAATVFFAMGAGDTTTETSQQVTVRDTFTYSNMQAYVVTNSIAATSTVTFRKNAASTTITFTIGSTGTGFFQDTTHSLLVAATDKVIIQCVGGTSSGNTLSPSSFVIWASLPTAPNFLDAWMPRTMVIEQWL